MLTRVLATRVLTCVAYVIYVGLAIAAFQESKKIFDADAELEFDTKSKTIKMPITFCTVESDGKLDIMDKLADIMEKLDPDCMDSALITNIVPVSATLSIIAIGVYVLLHCCRTGCTGGVAVGFGAALVLMLFQSMWSFFTIGFICDYYASLYSGWEYQKQEVSFILLGNKNIIWATGVAALLSSVLTAIDATLLASTARASTRAMGRTAGGTPAVGAPLPAPGVEFSPAFTTTSTTAKGGLGLPGSC